MLRVEQVSELALAHPRRPVREPRRILPRGHPQLLLVVLVREKSTEPLGCPGKIEYIL